MYVLCYYSDVDCRALELSAHEHKAGRILLCTSNGRTGDQVPVPALPVMANTTKHSKRRKTLIEKRQKELQRRERSVCVVM